LSEPRVRASAGRAPDLSRMLEQHGDIIKAHSNSHRKRASVGDNIWRWTRENNASETIYKALYQAGGDSQRVRLSGMATSILRSQAKSTFLQSWNRGREVDIAGRLHVTFIDKDGEEHKFEVSKGDNLLDIAQANDLEMEGMLEADLRFLVLMS
jgi:hypothetical protein